VGVGVGMKVVGVGIDVVDMDMGKRVVGWKREAESNKSSTFKVQH
jgi:hypothetical protein